METGSPLSHLNQRIIECRACPRLVEWRERVAREKRASFQDQEYWGKPVPNFGDPEADLLIVGLAPAAHGANRTGRMFTGDRSGDWLYRALHKAGLASQPNSQFADDGLELSGVMITAVCHCAPPDNKPSLGEIENCRGFLAGLLYSKQWRSILCLGGMAWTETHRCLGLRAPVFGHGVEALYENVNVPPPPCPPRRRKGESASGSQIQGVTSQGGQDSLRTDVPEAWRTIIASYHPSQQNTFTGRLTEAMLDEVVARFTSFRSPGRPA